jgi:hypothetical protein
MITVPPAYSEVPAIQSNPAEMTGFTGVQDQSQGQGHHQHQQPQPSYFGSCSQVVFCQAAPASYQAVNARYKNRQSIFIGVAQIVTGLLCIAFNATGIAINSSLNVIAYGIWGGILMIIAGSFGIAAGKLKSKCPIIAFMVLSIISACAAAVIISLAVLGAVIDDVEYSCSYYSYYYSRYYDLNCSVYKAMLAMNALLAILGGIGGIVSIWGSILGCMSCCCQTPNNHQVYSQPIQVVPTNGTQQVVYTTTPASVPQYIAYPGYPMQMGPTGQMQIIPNAPVTFAPSHYQPPPSGQVNNGFTGENMEKMAI